MLINTAASSNLIKAVFTYFFIFIFLNLKKSKTIHQYLTFLWYFLDIWMFSKFFPETAYLIYRSKTLQQTLKEVKFPILAQLGPSCPFIGSIHSNYSYDLHKRLQPAALIRVKSELKYLTATWKRDKRGIQTRTKYYIFLFWYKLFDFPKSRESVYFSPRKSEGKYTDVVTAVREGTS